MLDNKFLNNLYFNWWRNLDKTILTTFLLLFTLGLLFSLLSTSLVASDRLNTNNYFFFLKHCIFISIGIFTMFFFSILEKNKLYLLSYLFFLIFLISLTLVPFIGTEVKGSKRWLDIFCLPRFQPIEILKPFIIVVIATSLSLENKNYQFFKYFVSFLLILPIIILLVSQPDIGQTVLIFLTWLSLIFISGINLYLFFIFFSFILFSVLSLVIFVPKFEYILIRITAFLNPSSGNNYQSEKASEAIISGGFFGKGIGEGVLKNKVPEAHTDYIVSVISEEFGAIMIFFILLIFLIFLYKTFKNISYLKNDKIKFIIFGCSIIIFFQFLVHLGVNIRILPTTGMTLPFLSYGGSSIVGSSILAGIILNLTKKNIS